MVPQLKPQNVQASSLEEIFPLSPHCFPERFKLCLARIDRPPITLLPLSLGPWKANGLRRLGLGCVRVSRGMTNLRRFLEHDSWFDSVSSSRPDNYAPPRIHIGTPDENPTVLTRQDWRSNPTFRPDGSETPAGTGTFMLSGQQPTTSSYASIPGQSRGAPGSGSGTRSGCSRLGPAPRPALSAEWSCSRAKQTSKRCCSTAGSYEEFINWKCIRNRPALNS